MKALSSAAVLLSLISVSPAMAQQPAVIDGWDRLKFGMTIDEAVKATPEIRWRNPETCGKPEPQSRVTYCTLYGDSATIIAGVSFRPNLAFNQFGRLTTIRLSASDAYRTATTGQTCLEDGARIHAGLAGRFGPLHLKPIDEAGARGNSGATDNAAWEAWLAEVGSEARIVMQKDAPEKLVEAPPGTPRSFVAFTSFFSTFAGKGNCNQGVDYVSATLPRPIPKDTGKF